MHMLKTVDNDLNIAHYIYISHIQNIEVKKQNILKV
jgi:hypothetical protein